MGCARVRPTASISKTSTDLDKLGIITAYAEFLVFKCHAFGNTSISIDQHGGEDLQKVTV